MRILQLTVHFSPNVGGVETHLTDLVEGLAKKGHTIFVLTYRPLVKKASWKFFDKQKKNLTIIRLPWIPGFFYRFVASPTIEFIYLVPGLFISTPFFLLAENPDVIHAHGLVAGFCGVFWGKIFGKRTIVSTHNLYHFPVTGVYYTFAKWIFSNASVTLCLSDQSVEEIKKLGVSSENVKRFVYWVDVELFHPMQKEKIKRELDLSYEFNVLFVGRLIEIKGIRELIQASKDISNSVKIVIAGDGPMHDEVEDAAAKSDGEIIFIGAIDNKKLPLYYNAADVVIVPSTHDEGFGRVILEALSCGVPVIGSKRGAIPEAMDETVGRLITISPKNIAKTIMALQKNKSLLTKLSKSARSFALKRYSDKNLDDIIQIYEN